MKKVYAIEGLDALGKSTLIQNIMGKFGFYQTIHFSKPPKTPPPLYSSSFVQKLMYDDNDYTPVKGYQADCFSNSMVLAKSGAKIIFDRWHLGECVYAPMYRGYSGDYVFVLEHVHALDVRNDIRLILLTEDFEKSNHFVDDGLSLGDEEARVHEQNLFIAAFNKSTILDKKMICVTDPATGQFKSQEEILREATE